MKTIKLTDSHLMPGAECLRKTFLDRPHYDRLITDDSVVLKPDGSVLFVYIADAISPELSSQAYRTFRSVPKQSNNRQEAAGGRPTVTGIVGYWGRSVREPYCRRTEFTRDHMGAFRRSWPFITRVDQVFERYAPEGYAAQQRFVRQVSPDFRVADTVFTTFTVNDTWRTAAHTDSGDFRDGLGVMTVVGRGRYRGGELIFPQFRTAVDIRTGGVLLADVHELHGNAPIVGQSERYTRLSFIFYARKNMTRCGSRREELDRGRKTG